jgi:hypothetical protein
MRHVNPRLDNVRGGLFLVAAILSGYLSSNAIQERIGYVHTQIDWLGGALASLVGIALDLGYRRQWGGGEGWRKYLGTGGGSIYYLPIWCLALGALVGSCIVFFQGGARW